MNYFSFIEKCRNGIPVEKVIVRGGQTQGRLHFDEPKPRQKAKRKTNIMVGCKYADEVKNQERLENLRLQEEAESAGTKMDEVDDLTTIGTLPNILDLENNDTTVYSTYDFKKKPTKELLIHQYKDEILEQVNSNQVTIIKGATGCGKTTQVPQFILDQHQQLNMHCSIIVTQPRRIAAVSVAKRVCQERQWPLGSVVGYQIGLDCNVSKDTRLMYATTGVLLQIIVKQQSLKKFTHIIVDEVHERDSETDFLLIVLRKLMALPQCRTKIILMSATIHLAPFIQYFTREFKHTEIEPPVIEVRLSTQYPVQYYYLDSLERSGFPAKIPLVQMSNAGIDKDLYELSRKLIEVFHAIDKTEHEGDNFLGSVLVFLPGIVEIETMFDKLDNIQPKNGEKWWICPLHSCITYEEQMKVFKPAPENHRKIILATNIAESSITVSDVKYVIDFCLTKQLVLELETGYASLKMTWISRSQGTQRAGRVGRVMPGRVYRLLTKTNYMDLAEDSTPEILRCSLDLLVLKAKQLNMGSPEYLLGLAMDPPDLSYIHKTVLQLKELGALLLTANGIYADNDGDLTFVGHIMASLPLEPHLSKLIIMGHMFSLLPEAIIMASGLSLKSIFSTPFQMQLKAYTSKLSWADFSCSDPIAFLNAYSLWKYKTRLGFFKRSGGQSEKDWCRSRFIQMNVIKEVSRLETELTTRLRNLGLADTQGDFKVVWTDIEKSLILKLMLAGAFYPNYFFPLGVDEKEAVKVLGGRDPFNTVYLTGMPHDQPGLLYSHFIKNYFTHCGSAIDVTFDGSSKVYLQFGSSTLETDDPGKESLIPGKVSLAVYRALKLRQLQIEIKIPLLHLNEAKKRAEEIFGDGHHLTSSLFKKPQKNIIQKKSQMPSIGTNILRVIVTHIDNPSRFWVNINDDTNENRIYWIHTTLNKNKNIFPQFRGPFCEGALCIAPYREDNRCPILYYRAMIRSYKLESSVICVFFIDYGNEETINIKELRDYPQNLNSLKEEPPLALQATLAEIGPSLNKNYLGNWAAEANVKFRNYLRDSTAVAKIYSAVNNVMSVHLYSQAVLTVNKDMSFESSLNSYLIKCGLAELCDEPYLSRENNILRDYAERCPESACMQEVSYFETASKIKFNPPKESECTSRVTLKGPKSPLEVKISSLCNKCQGRDAIIEWNSVNSVLLDNYPMDPHLRLIVACTVSQSANDKLTLKNTTVMPNIHGLASLICLLFAPRIELRADNERQNLIGALCGLGFDADGNSLFPENDIEVTFDTKFNLLDLETINKIRFWMDRILGGGEGPDVTIPRGEIARAQNKIRGYILDILNKKRQSMSPMSVPTPYEWDLIPSEDLLDPRGGVPTNLYPLIWGINLVGDGKRDKAIFDHLKDLESYANGNEIMRAGTQCELCNIYLESVSELRLHLATNLHRTKVTDLQECS